MENMLDDDEGGCRFPITVRMTPLVRVPGKPVLSQWNWNQATARKGNVSVGELQEVARLAPQAEVTLLGEDLQACQEEREKLAVAFREKAGTDDAPAFLRLQKALEDCHFLVQSQLVQKEEPQPTGPGTTPPGPQTPANRPLSTTRSEAYRQLEQAAGLPRKLEPHSPFPLLIEHIVKLEHAEFPKLIKIIERVIPLLKELGVETESTEG
jgi:hypothetical protein